MNAPKPRARRRGQATVEMAILMVILVPTLLYVLTADDLLRYRLNLQEVVVASPWDYTHLDYEGRNVAGEALQEHLRRAYANVNVGHSAEAAASPTGEKTAPMTFAGWDEAGSQRVSCERRGIAEELPNSSGLAQALAGQANRGGLYACNAALGVRNVLLVNRFFQEWAGDVEVTDKTQGGAAGDAAATWGLNRQHFSVMADTWAMTRVEGVDPSTSSRGKTLYRRVQSIYNASANHASAQASAMQLASRGQSIGVLNSAIITQDTDAGTGDNAGTPEVGFSTGAPPSIKGFETSPWSHPGARGGKYEEAYRGRQTTYMGDALK